MVRPAVKFQLEDPMEERVAKLKANIEHIRSDVSDIKTDVRRLNDKIDGVNKDLSGKIDTVIQEEIPPLHIADIGRNGRTGSSTTSVQVQSGMSAAAAHLRISARIENGALRQGAHASHKYVIS
jgi:hypothetical protein